MGGRMLRKWILLPLKNKVMIDERLAIVKFLVENDELSEELVGIIKNIGDLERLASKIATSKINPAKCCS